MDKLESLHRRCPIVPYRNVLKAFAYHNSDFDQALRAIELFDFAIPYPGDPKRKSLKKRYEWNQRQAQKLSPTFKISEYQLRKKDIQEMYHWISTLGFEDSEVGEDVLAMREMLSDIRDINLRRAVCTMLRLYYTPEEIAKELRNPVLNVIAEWGSEQITTFWHYWWDVEKMHFEDWMSYLGWVKPNDRHFHYMHRLIRYEDARTIRWESNLLRKVDDQIAIDEMKADAYCLSKAAKRVGDIKGFGTAVTSFAKIFDLEPKDGSGKDSKVDDIFKDLRLIMTKKQIEEEGLTQVGVRAPKSLDDVGDFNDPTDIGEDLESFTDDE